MSITSRHTASSHVHDKARSFPETYLALPRRYRACSISRGVKQGQSIRSRIRQHGQPHSQVTVIVSVDTERLTTRNCQGLFILAANSVCSLLAEQDETARRKWYILQSRDAVANRAANSHTSLCVHLYWPNFSGCKGCTRVKYDWITNLKIAKSCAANKSVAKNMEIADCLSAED